MSKFVTHILDIGYLTQVLDYFHQKLFTISLAKLFAANQLQRQKHYVYKSISWSALSYKEEHVYRWIPKYIQRSTFTYIDCKNIINADE